MTTLFLLNFVDGVRDASPFNRPIAVKGTLSLAPGQFGEGADFTLGSLGALVPLPGDFTVEFWIDGSGVGTILEKVGDPCPVPCGMPRLKLRFKRIRIGVANEVLLSDA